MGNNNLFKLMTLDANMNTSGIEERFEQIAKMLFESFAMSFNVLRLGCAVLLAHLDPVHAETPNCSANHLPVFFCSTSTTLMRFKSCAILNLLSFNANLYISDDIDEENLINLSTDIKIFL